MVWKLGSWWQQCGNGRFWLPDRSIIDLELKNGVLVISSVGLLKAKSLLSLALLGLFSFEIGYSQKKLHLSKKLIGFVKKLFFPKRVEFHLIHKIPRPNN